MKDVATFISIATLVLVVGYVTYYEKNNRVEKGAISDNAVMSVSEPMQTAFIAKSFALPTTMSFADETVPLQINDVRERLDRELQLNSYLHSST